MRKWVLICGCADKSELWKGIYRRVLIRRAMKAAKDDTEKANRAQEVNTWADKTVAQRDTPKYAVMDMADENGDYAIVDMDTGEIQHFIAKHLHQISAWACIRYLDPIEDTKRTGE